MVALEPTRKPFEEYDELDTFEKISRGRDGLMPVHHSGAALRAKHRTPASRSAARRVSRTTGGAHRRAQKQRKQGAAW